MKEAHESPAVVRDVGINLFLLLPLILALLASI